MSLCHFEKIIRKWVLILFEQTFITKCSIMQIPWILLSMTFSLTKDSSQGWKSKLKMHFEDIGNIKRNAMVQLHTISEKGFFWILQLKKKPWNKCAQEEHFEEN